jgi:hypothetical protein
MATPCPWRIAISHTHPGLARIFAGTDWGGLPGAPGAWAQMLGRMPGAIKQIESGKPLRLRFDGHPEYCTALPWDSVLPPAKDDEGEDEMVSERDAGMSADRAGFHSLAGPGQFCAGIIHPWPARRGARRSPSWR